MKRERVYHDTYRALNKPLTLLGAERRLFFVAVTIAAVIWNLMGGFFPSLVLFIAFHAFSVWATRNDPQILRIIMQSAALRRRYDPGKWPPAAVERSRTDVALEEGL